MADPLFLLDSSICICLLRGGSDIARARVQERAPGELATSAVAFAEVMIGAKSRDAVPQADAFFSLVTVLPFDRAAARACAVLPFKRGRYDRLIAAHALALRLTLVTNNERDFDDIPDLKIENWTL